MHFLCVFLIIQYKFSFIFRFLALWTNYWDLLVMLAFIILQICLVINCYNYSFSTWTSKFLSKGLDSSRQVISLRWQKRAVETCLWKSKLLLFFVSVSVSVSYRPLQPRKEMQQPDMMMTNPCNHRLVRRKGPTTTTTTTSTKFFLMTMSYY